MTVFKIAEVALEMWGAIFSLIAAACIDLSKRAERRENVELGYMLAMNSIMLTADGFAIAFRGYPGTFGRIMVYVSNYMTFASMYILSYLSVRFIRALIQQNGGDIPKYFSKIMYITCAGSIVFLTVSQLNGMIYYIDEANFYHRGALWWISQIPVFLGMLSMLIIIPIYGKGLKRKERFAAFSYIALPVLAWAIQTQMYGISLVNIATTISLFLMFAVYELGKSIRMVEQAERLVEQEKRNHEWEMRLLREQIQPHFIFNSMSVIQVLCRKDSKTAAEAIQNFSSYLRNSIDLYDKKEMIPLENEISILENYLYLERLRYGEKLQVEYHLEAMNFNVPAFSVQPIVENAIKYGIRPRLEGGTVTISSFETENEYQIAVADDGVGFQPDRIADDGVNHVGLKNVSSRLHLICNGKLEVSSAPGEGCLVKIKIPRIP